MSDYAFLYEYAFCSKDVTYGELTVKTRKILLIAFLSGSTTSTAGASLLLGDATKGEALHEQKCVGCHVARFGGDGSGIYTRKNRRVNSIEGLIGQVNNCNAMTRSNLSDDDINDVVKYLNDTYYRFGE